MISIAQALQFIQDQAVELRTGRKPLGEALGYALAETIVAPFDVPAFNNSSVDGYALAGEAGYYTIVGEIAAGDTGEKFLEPGQAMRIFTGARVPEQATHIAMQEYVELSGDQLRITRPLKAGQFIRLKGGELKKGSDAFRPGENLSPAALGFLASLGYQEVPVYQKPRVMAIATGNELLQPGEPWAEGKIFESNRTAVSAALNDKGYDLIKSASVADDQQAIAERVNTYLEEADVLLVTGGISVGDYDFVKPALEQCSVEEIFHKVNQKPGKPLYFGRKGRKFVFGLPGNPASALTCFYVYVLPLLQRMSGAGGEGLLRLSFPLAHDYDFNGDRPSFLKASIKNGAVTVLDGQLSSMILSFARANALAYLESPRMLKAGEAIECLLL